MMNNPEAILKEIICGRRSVRKFLDLSVSKELLDQVIDAGRMAPSSTNSQPWYFYILSGEDTRQVADILSEDAEKLELAGYRNIILESARIAAQAPHIITVWNMKRLSNRLEKIKGLIGETYYRDYERAEIASIGCAVENMWMMAHCLGLGMVWLMAGLISLESCRKKFKIEGDIVAYLALGYPAESKTKVEKKRKPLSEICSFYSS